MPFETHEVSPSPLPSVSPLDRREREREQWRAAKFYIFPAVVHSWTAICSSFTIFTYRRRGRGVRLKAGSSKGGVGLVAKSGGRGLPPPPLPVPCLSGYRPLPDSIQRPMGLDGRGRSGGRELFTSSWPGWNLSDYILQPRSRLLSEARANQEIIKKKKKEGESNRRQLFFSSFFSSPFFLRRTESGIFIRVERVN